MLKHDIAGLTREKNKDDLFDRGFLGSNIVVGAFFNCRGNGLFVYDVFVEVK